MAPDDIWIVKPDLGFVAAKPFVGILRLLLRKSKAKLPTVFPYLTADGVLCLSARCLCVLIYVVCDVLAVSLLEFTLCYIISYLRINLQLAIDSNYMYRLPLTREAEILVKSRNFSYTHLYLTSPLRMTPLEF